MGVEDEPEVVEVFHPGETTGLRQFESAVSAMEAEQERVVGDYETTLAVAEVCNPTPAW